MGIIVNSVREAFDKYRAGDFDGFVMSLTHTACKYWGWHTEIVIEEVEYQLKLLKEEKNGRRNK
jgi:hypothetical protein